jgi:hypothetical protein
MTATSLVEIGQEKIHHAITLVFHGHHIPLHRVGDRHRSLCLAGAPPPATRRSIAASANTALAFLVPGSCRRTCRLHSRTPQAMGTSLRRYSRACADIAP